jgi:mono/diheme cytochrome c family protein
LLPQVLWVLDHPVLSLNGPFFRLEWSPGLFLRASLYRLECLLRSGRGFQLELEAERQQLGASVAVENPEYGFAEEAERAEFHEKRGWRKTFMRPFRTMAVMLLTAGALSCITTLSFAATKVKGADIFREKCSMCHGVDGKGYAAIKTPDFTDPKWQAAHPDKELKDAVENGVKGTAMVSFKDKLSQQEVAAVLKYIRSLDTKKK